MKKIIITVNISNKTTFHAEILNETPHTSLQTPRVTARVNM